MDDVSFSAVNEKDNKAESYCVYVIQSKTTQGIYIGQTSDLEKRLNQHNNPTNKLTKHTKLHKGPWQLVHCEVYSSRTEARQREMALKSGQGRHWLKKLLACKQYSPYNYTSQ